MPEKNVIIYGSGEIAQLVLQKFTTFSYYDNYCCSGVIVEKNDKRKWWDDTIQLLGTSDVLPEIVNRYKPDELLIAHSSLECRKVLEWLGRLKNIKTKIWLVSPYLHLLFCNPRKDNIMTVPVVRLNCRQMNILERIFKRLFDIIVSFICIIITLPLWSIICVLIVISSSGPVIFSQERIGYKGHVFKIYKFRSMYKNTKKFARAPHSMEDERITFVGRWLRRTSLDELPQLINVIKGEMSLVGPRPEMPFIVSEYKEWQKRRLDVLPGVTGLWQIMGRTKQEYIHERLEFDFYYILNQSFLLDIKILLKTIIAVVKCQGAF